tara:strand:- start:500 stop:748 length:249 start_codon:yes stop_codon:yes gene_type:complete
MEIIILVSVLSTLGVVAIVGAIVVAFKKLNNKVDVINHDIDTQNLYKSIDNIHNDIGNEISNIYSTIDSRCDKLYDLLNQKK